VVALGGHKQVLLYHVATGELLGILPFPEGTIHSLRFTRDGGILLAAGGRAAQKGLAVAFDVATGERLFEVGGEYDVVLSADISPDRSLVALGGPSKVLRVFRTADGELAYECRKHTEWVTAVAFSPDGVLLASGDRNGGLLVWEAGTGREFYDLRGHSAMIDRVDWRLDSNLLASASEDGTIRLWEMANGTQVKSISAHGGATAVTFAKDGRLISSGRDRVARLWDGNGAQQREFEALGDMGLQAVLSFDDTLAIAADWNGTVRVWNVADGARVADLPANPPPLSARIEQLRQALVEAQGTVAAAAAQRDPLQAAAQAAIAAHEAAAAALGTAEQAATRLPDAVKTAQDALAALDRYVAAAAGLAPTDAASATRTELADRAATLQQALDRAPEQTAAARAAVEAAAQARAAAEKAMADHTAALAGAEARVSAIQAQLGSLEARAQTAAVPPDAAPAATP
jgi:hypothetical protein